MTHDEQLQLWLDGKPVHGAKYGDERDIEEDGECCPDFSCCRPDLLWPYEVRKRFVEANQKKRNGMLFSSMASLVREVEEETGKKVEIAR